MTALKKIQDNTAEPESSAPAKIIPLTGLKGITGQNNKAYVNGIWALVKSAFWLYNSFSGREVRTFKQLIKQHFVNTKTPQANFMELSQRIALVKLLSLFMPSHRPQAPGYWLNIRNRNGMAGSNYHLQVIQFIRQKDNSFRSDLKDFSRGLLGLVERNSDWAIRHYRRALLRKGHRALLQLFYNTIIHYQY